MMGFVRAAAGLLRHNFHLQGRPWKATFSITDRCNSRCLYCGIWRKGKGREMTPGEIGRALSSIGPLGWLDIMGGEPSMREDFIEVLGAAMDSARPWILHFATNGLLTDRIIEASTAVLSRKDGARPGRLVVTVSIDGPPGMNDRIRGRPGAFETACATLSALKGLKSPRLVAVAGMTIGRENLGSIKETFEAIRRRLPSFEPGDLHINLAQRSEAYYANSDLELPDPASAVKAFEEVERLAEAGAAGRLVSPHLLLESLYRRHLPRFLISGTTPIPCRSLVSNIFVQADGTVHPCITDPRVAGRLTETAFDLGAIYRSPRAGELRRSIAAGDCPHCWTPCEAYPTILSSIFSFRTWRRRV